MQVEAKPDRDIDLLKIQAKISIEQNKLFTSLSLIMSSLIAFTIVGLQIVLTIPPGGITFQNMLLILVVYLMIDVVALYCLITHANNSYNSSLKKRIEPDFDKVAQGKAVSLWD